MENEGHLYASTPLAGHEVTMLKLPELRDRILTQDPRNYQILFLSLFLVLGIGTRDWTLRADLIGVVMITCLLTQWIALSLWGASQICKNLGSGSILLPEIRASGQDARTTNLQKWDAPSLWANPNFSALKSAMITALSLSLLLRADNYRTMILAGSLAILSKFLFQVRGKHFFNPANFGIIAALILTDDAWISPGQWGDDGWYALLFAGTGGLVLKRVGRWDTTAAFLGAYALLEAIRNLWLGWTWDVFVHRLMSGSLLLFALFMLTDPRSIPNARVSRLIWAGCIALLTFILQNQFFVSTAIFWALFSFSPFIIILDSLYPSSRFFWKSQSPPLESS